jgi:hypothetical protein
MEPVLFKNIEGWPNYYISNTGIIASDMTGKFKEMKPQSDKDGYLRILLYRSHEKKMFRIHRLVAKAFIANPNDYPIIDHIDKNVKNNHVKNLRWCTFAQNSLNRKAMGSIRLINRRKKFEARLPIYDKENHVVGKKCKLYTKRFYTEDEAKLWLDDMRERRQKVIDDLIF